MPSKILNKLYYYTAPNGLCAWLVLIQAYIYSNEFDSTIPEIGQGDLQERETRRVIRRILKEMTPVLLEMEGDESMDEMATNGLAVLTEYSTKTTITLEECYSETFVLLTTLVKLLTKFKIDANIWLTDVCHIGSEYDKGEYKLDTIVRNGKVVELLTAVTVGYLPAHRVIDIAESGKNGRRVVNIFQDTSHFYICTSDDVKFNVDKVKVWGKKSNEVVG